MTDDVTRPLPHAIGPEKAVLSVLFQFPETIDDCDSLTPAHFHLPAHRIIFESIRHTINSGHALELVSFVERLRMAGILDRVGGSSAITDIYTYQPDPKHIAQHIDILTENLICRLAIAKGAELAESGYSCDTEAVAESVRSAATALEEAATGQGAGMTLKEIVKDSMAQFEARVHQCQDTMGIETISEIDECTKGLHPGRVYVVCAYPKGGKSILSSQMLLQCVLAGHPGLFLTMEMTEREIMDRMIIQASRMDAEAFTSPKTYADKHNTETTNSGILKHVQNSALALARSPLAIVRPKNRNIATIAAAVRRKHREARLKVAVIDFAQLIKCPGKTGVEEMEEISHTIHQLAQDLGIAIILPSQLNADGDTKNGRVIEEDAAFVLNIVQDRNKDSETYKKHRHILVVADRFNGTSGNRIPLIFDEKRIRFVHGEDQTAAGQKKSPKFKR
jgi:replicative DNA helicase